MSLPPAWESSWAAHLPHLRGIQSALGFLRAFPTHTPRIGQLDAELLDEELAQVLQEPLAKAFEGVRSSWRGVFNLELGLLIRLILYKFSIWDNAASYGASLQGLKLADTRAPGSPIRRKKLLLHALLTLGIPYLHARIRGYALSRAWPDAPSTDRRRRAWAWLTSAENAHAVLGLAGFVAFLWDGRYRTLTDRLLGLRLVPSRRVDRVVSYEFMNRQIVWHALTEFLLFLVPLVDVAALRRRLRQYLFSLRKSPYLPSPVRTLLERDSTSTSSEGEQKGPYATLPSNECAICARRAALPNLPYPLANQLAASSIIVGASVPTYPVQTPYVASCGHVYCYVCLTEQMVAAADEGEEGWSCLRCNKVVKSAARLKADDSEVVDADEEDLGDPDAVTPEAD
ncbi:hypothetical protein CALVIDRAFT_595441 [Calocera viscosa TUFC12733]|uniref:RING-type E3 ubiquitin transferase (cysteine targeting) n=1 Tax=Calocera viscosa (strain TUFC12733) TaxID=1330018 RepID=A0A167QK79_CALVF|nr:hypothetical protein CALVIDRAFT_595441 [Calocera viscosa TUFC12733]